jgi:hypothetical protein
MAMTSLGRRSCEGRSCSLWGTCSSPISKLFLGTEDGRTGVEGVWELVGFVDFDLAVRTMLAGGENFQVWNPRSSRRGIQERKQPPVVGMDRHAEIMSAPRAPGPFCLRYEVTLSRAYRNKRNRPCGLAGIHKSHHGKEHAR